MKHKVFIYTILAWGMVSVIPQYKVWVRDYSLSIAFRIVNGRQQNSQVALAEEFGETNTNNLATAKSSTFTIASAPFDESSKTVIDLASSKLNDQFNFTSSGKNTRDGLPILMNI